MPNQVSKTAIQRLSFATAGLIGFVLVSAPWYALAQESTGNADDAQDKTPPAKQLKLVNPGLESGDDSPQGWKQGAKISGVKYTWDRKAGYKSKSSLRLRKTAKRYFPIAQWVQSVPHTDGGAKLQVSGWVKAKQVHKAILDVQFVSKDGKWTHKWAAYIGAKKSDDPPADHDWKQYSGTVAIPDDTKELRIGLQIYGPGTVWFDQIEACYVD